MLVEAKHKTALDKEGNPLIATFEKTVWQTKIMQGGEWKFVKYVTEPDKFKSVVPELKTAPIKTVVSTRSCGPCGRK
jgi:hypothetical protein